MKRILVILCLLIACLGSAQVPFSGVGVNTHGQLLPVARLRAIGVRWVRADLPVQEVTRERVQRILDWYRGMPVLWLLSQKTPNPAAVCRLLCRWGVTEIELGNEPELGKYNPDGLAWQGARYGKWFAGIRSAVIPNKRTRWYGPATSYWNPDYIANAVAAGMRADGIDFHGYGSTALAVDSDTALKRWGLPVVVSEVGPSDQDGPAALWFLAHARAMGERPWCYYDGPDTNGRGLFGWSGKAWDVPTAVYEQIASALATRRR